MPIIAGRALRRAVDNVAHWGDTDIFPHPVENHILYDMPDRVTDLLANIASKFESEINRLPVDSYSTLSPVGYTGFRWVTQIEPVWNAYLLAQVVALAPQIEGERLSEDSNKVFSYRYRAATTDSSLFATDGWKKFQETTRQQAESHNYVVSVDIGDFYARIYHHRLENALRAVDRSGTKTKHIMAILTKLSGGTSYGLPVGGPAARILAELVLNRVDHLIVAQSRIHSALTRRLVQAIQYMDAIPRQQAILSLLENIEVLAPVIPQVMMAIRDSVADSEPEFIDRVHAIIRGLIQEHHYVAQVDLNLAFMIRALSVRHSTENELLLIQLYQAPHSFGSGFAPYIQRDIMLILARWGVTYWLSDQKNYISTAPAWVKRAFIIASYVLGDEGKHWRNTSMRVMGDFEHLTRDWAASKWQQDGSWQVPL
jgi:hypothetical protein